MKRGANSCLPKFRLLITISRFPEVAKFAITRDENITQGDALIE